MRTAIALTLLVSGLIVRVCLNLHHLLAQPTLPSKELVAEQEMETPYVAAASLREEPKEVKINAKLKQNAFAPMQTDHARQVLYTEAKFSDRCLQGDAHTCQQDVVQKRKSCEEGNLIDCNTLAWMHIQGAAGIKAEPSQAIALLDSACTRGGRSACSSLGSIYKEGKGGIAKDETKSIEYFKKNCTSQNATNCYDLALMYYDGKSTLADKDSVVPLMLQSCEDNHISACKWLAENNIADISPSNTALTLK